MRTGINSLDVTNSRTVSPWLPTFYVTDIAITPYDLAIKMAFSPVFWVYTLLQWILNRIFSPSPPPPNAQLRRPKIAVIGAGLTDVSTAALCVGHRFEVTLFEAGDKEHVGGIWIGSLDL